MSKNRTQGEILAVLFFLESIDFDGKGTYNEKKDGRKGYEIVI